MEPNTSRYQGVPEERMRRNLANTADTAASNGSQFRGSSISFLGYQAQPYPTGISSAPQTTGPGEGAFLSPVPEMPFRHPPGYPTPCHPMAGVQADRDHRFQQGSSMPPSHAAMEHQQIQWNSQIQSCCPSIHPGFNAPPLAPLPGFGPRHPVNQGEIQWATAPQPEWSHVAMPSAAESPPGATHSIQANPMQSGSRPAQSDGGNWSQTSRCDISMPHSNPKQQATTKRFEKAEETKLGQMTTDAELSIQQSNDCVLSLKNAIATSNAEVGQIEPFDGEDPSDWLKFYDDVEDLMESFLKLDYVDLKQFKWEFYSRQIKGKAFDLISHLPDTKESLSIAKTILTLHYDWDFVDPESSRKFLAVKPVSQDVSNIKDFLNEIEEILPIDQQSDQDPDVVEDFLEILSTKLPKDLFRVVLIMMKTKSRKGSLFMRLIDALSRQGVQWEYRTTVANRQEIWDLLNQKLQDGQSKQNRKKKAKKSKASSKSSGINKSKQKSSKKSSQTSQGPNLSNVSYRKPASIKLEQSTVASKSPCTQDQKSESTRVSEADGSNERSKPDNLRKDTSDQSNELSPFESPAPNQGDSSLSQSISQIAIIEKAEEIWGESSLVSQSPDATKTVSNGNPTSLNQSSPKPNSNPEKPKQIKDHEERFTMPSSQRNRDPPQTSSPSENKSIQDEASTPDPILNSAPIQSASKHTKEDRTDSTNTAPDGNRIPLAHSCSNLPSNDQKPIKVSQSSSSQGRTEPHQTKSSFKKTSIKEERSSQNPTLNKALSQPTSDTIKNNQTNETDSSTSVFAMTWKRLELLIRALFSPDQASPLLSGLKWLLKDGTIELKSSFILNDYWNAIVRLRIKEILKVKRCKQKPARISNFEANRSILDQKKPPDIGPTQSTSDDQWKDLDSLRFLFRGETVEPT